MEKIKTRFAPSPTGLLHIGGARTAAFNWALARKNKGVFLLRIEDTDKERSSLAFEKTIIEDLHWLGLDWDEGPYRQSERLEVYQSFFDVLKKKNLVYPCYCTPQELEEERTKALKAGKPPRYSGKCFFLSPEERRRKETDGYRPSWRFRIPSGSEISFFDLVRGKMVFHPVSLGDFIILKSDGIPTYNFACVVDDALMGISHILRGEEHLSNTPYQILLYRALEFPLPVFAHLPIILDENRAKLSKRRRDISLRSLRERGILAQALFNYLFTLGHSFEEGKEVLDREAIIASFSLSRVGKSGAIFDEEKIRWMNKIYLRKTPWTILREYFQQLQGGEAFEKLVEKLGNERFTRLWSLACEEASDLQEVWQVFRGFVERPGKVVLEAERLEFLKVLRKKVEQVPCWINEEEVKSALQAWQRESGIKPAIFYKTLRLVLIGREEGPELHRLLFALGREELLARLSDVVKDEEV